MDEADLKVGIYGGAFDPVHNTHLRLAQAATKQIGLDKLIWVPTGNAWHKPGSLTDAKHRIAMLNLAFEALETLPDEDTKRWQISTIEIKRPTPSYTIDTLLQLQLLYPNAQWYILIGADQFVKLHTWKRWPELVSLASFVVAKRSGVALNKTVIDPMVCKHATWAEVAIKETDDSSTQIRALVKQASKGDELAFEQLAQLMPACVLHYIQYHHLYE